MFPRRNKLSSNVLLKRLTGGVKYVTSQLSISCIFLSRLYIVWHNQWLSNAWLGFQWIFFPFPRNAFDNCLKVSLLSYLKELQCLKNWSFKCTLCKTVLMDSVTDGILFQIALIYYSITVLCLSNILLEDKYLYVDNNI